MRAFYRLSSDDFFLILENQGIRVKRNRLGEIVRREVPHYLALSWFPKARLLENTPCWFGGQWFHQKEAD